MGRVCPDVEGTSKEERCGPTVAQPGFAALPLLPQRWLQAPELLLSASWQVLSSSEAPSHFEWPPPAPSPCLLYTSDAADEHRDV